MNEAINFPLGTPQVQVAERIQNQIHHNPANAQHAMMEETRKDQEIRREIVNETTETEENTVDQEGHSGAEYEGRQREAGAGDEEVRTDGTTPSSEDGLQGRFINVVV